MKVPIGFVLSTPFFFSSLKDENAIGSVALCLFPSFFKNCYGPRL